MGAGVLVAWRPCGLLGCNWLPVLHTGALSLRPATATPATSTRRPPLLPNLDRRCGPLLITCADGSLASFLQWQRRQRCIISSRVYTSRTRSLSHFGNCPPAVHLGRSYERRGFADRNARAFRIWHI